MSSQANNHHPVAENNLVSSSSSSSTSVHAILIQKYYILLTRGCRRFHETQAETNPAHQHDTNNHAPLCALYVRRYKQFNGDIQLPEVSRLALVLSTTGKEYLTCGQFSLWTLQDEQMFANIDWTQTVLPKEFRTGWVQFTDHQLKTVISRFVHQVQQPLVPCVPEKWPQSFASLNHLVHFLVPRYQPDAETGCCGLDLNHIQTVAAQMSQMYDASVTAWTEFLSHFTIGLQSLHSGILPVLLSVFLIWAYQAPVPAPPASTTPTSHSRIPALPHHSVSTLPTQSTINQPITNTETRRLPIILVVQICNIVHRLPPLLHPELARWILTSPEAAPGTDRAHAIEILHRIVTAIHEAISFSYSPATRMGTDGNDESHDMGAVSSSDAIHAIKALKVFDIINRKYTLLPASVFYHPDINTHFSSRAEYLRWKSSIDAMEEKKDPSTPLPLALYPFILNPASKADLLKIESTVHQRHHLQATFFRAMFVGVHSPFLDLVIRRSHAVRDTLVQLGSVTDQKDLRKQLRVQFVDEPGMDEGGVARELLALVMRGLIDPVYNMFETQGSVIWFSPDAKVFGTVGSRSKTVIDADPSDSNIAMPDSRIEEEFELVGKVVGIALYNSIVLQVRFPLALFKKLLDQPLLIDDLAEIDPMLASAMNTLANFPADDVADTYCRTFSIEEQVGLGEGASVTVDLIPNGRRIDLTGDNRTEYITRILDYYLNARVATAFKAFRKGFDSVTKESSIQQLFNPEELSQVVLGDEELDLDALKEQAVYDGGYTASSPVVRYLWQVLGSLSTTDLRRFLFFVTGTDRAPVGGLGKVTLTVMRQGPDSDRLPSAHTCFNVIMVPEYASLSKLEERLRKALDNLEGFGLI